MKFNMGCGQNSRDGYVNVDSAAGSSADEIWDLEVTPWPWADNCAEEIIFIHSLEHMGGDPKVFLKIMQEIYRIGRPGCRVLIHVPHPRHDHFIGDPTHVRPITPPTLRLFDRELNEQWKRNGNANTPLAFYLGVDFKVVDEKAVLDTEVRARFDRGEITTDQIHRMIRHEYNIISELRMVLEVRKGPPTATEAQEP